MILPFPFTGMDPSLKVDAFSEAFPGHCSIGQMISALGFSLGMNSASALGVVGVSSSSLKNGTCKRAEWLKSKTYHIQLYER